MSEFVDLRILCESYLGTLFTDTQSIVELFIQIKSDKRLKTTANVQPTFSIRLLCRALKFALYHHKSVSMIRALFDGFHLFFTSNLDYQSTEIVISSIKDKLRMNQNYQFSEFCPHLENLPFLYKGDMINVVDGIQFPAGPLFTNRDYKNTQSILDN